MLIRKPRSGAGEAGLDLVEHEQNATFGAQFTYRREVARVDLVDAALALDRLEQHRCDRVVQALLQRVDIVVLHVAETLGKRLERLVLLGLTSCGQRSQGASVERAHRRYDDMTASTTRFASKFDQRLVGFAA